MRRALLLLLLSSCVETRSVALTFGSVGEGLDGFMCKDDAGVMLLERLPGDGQASLVIDFVRLGGVPGCRTGQLMEWCKTHDCVPIESTRTCRGVKLPLPAVPRDQLRAQILEAMRSLGAPESSASADAPDEFVLVRAVGTTQSCDTLLPDGGAPLPAFDQTKLVGCAYSCPVLFDKIEQDVYLGFETNALTCEQGVRICSDGQLHWQP